MSTVATLATDVIARMGNRTDIGTRAQYWVFEALIQLTSTTDFEELETTGPNFNLTSGTGVYALSNFVQTNDVLQTIMDLVVYTDLGTNTTTLKLNYSDIQEADKITPLSGTYPVQWSRMSTSSALSVMVRPVPNAAYTMFMRYRRQHPLTATIPYDTTTVLLPTEWDIVIKYVAMVMGYDELKEHDRAATLKQRVYGGRNPTTGIEELGMIKSLMVKRQREQPLNVLPLRPHYGMTRTCPM